MLGLPSEEAPHWWYHYYSEGYGAKITNVTPEHLFLSRRKYTPDFRNYEYRYGICHWQIGNSAVERKTYVVMKTTVGVPNPPLGCVPTTSYVVGYFRVKRKDVNRGMIVMDPRDSLLLLESPIRITPRFALRFLCVGLEPRKTSFSQIIGSCTRNRRLSAHDARILISRLRRRHLRGSKDFLGCNYPGPTPKKI